MEGDLGITVDAMFVLAIASVAWGLSLATYRWFAVQNGWTMGEWQSQWPILPRVIGLAAVIVAMLFALARGFDTAILVLLFGLLGAFCWTGVFRVGAQSALLLAPLAAAIVALAWSLTGA
jgi:uncharacterized membrane protein